MTDSGVSIFDQRPDEDPDDQATRQMSLPGRVIPPPARPVLPQAALPVVRRGGYDRDAVDARLRELARTARA